MSNGSGTIIIKGGSVEVVYESSTYPVDPTDPNRHSNEDLKIRRVVITGDLSYDSGEKPEGWACEITAFCS